MKIRIARRKTHSTSTNRLLRWSRNTFFVIGILALGYSAFVLLDTGLFQAYQARQFQKQLEGEKLHINSAGDVRYLSVASLPGGALGRIEIARIGVSAIIMEGIDARTLRRSVGHIPGTSLPGKPGNVGIAGHRDTFFRALRNVQQDDEIRLTTLQGSYQYLVDSTELVASEDTQVLDDSGGTNLTLVTCYPFYFVGPAPKRFIVRAHKISG